MDKKYTIEFTEQQLRTVATGLEFYSRFLAGQWEIPDAMEFNEYKLQDKYEGFWQKRNEVKEQLSNLKSLFTGMHINQSYGIGSDKLHEDAKIAYDTYRPILEQFAKEHNTLHPEEVRYSVYDSPGLPYSKDGRIKVNTL
jgi:hypothetical protein